MRILMFAIYFMYLISRGLVLSVLVCCIWLGQGESFRLMRGIIPFRTVRGLQAVSKVESSARTPHLPRFILLGSFSDTLLVVWILGMAYDCHLQIAICSSFCSPEGVINSSCGSYGSFLAWVCPFGACGLCPKSRAWRARASPSEVYPDGKLQ